ncbi:MAG: ABC transporter permease [Nanoarchaeota archaeon]|nr:ABC transporter permease [Nanoarchaeota archaeon]MBU1854648.1 ABC transporter permease [Nanoarchaeota archaeon]
MKHLVSLWEMIWKHFRIIIRSKITLLTIFMGPLLIIFIIGMAFNNQSLHSINIGLFVDTGLNETNISQEIDNPSVMQIYELLNNSFSVSQVASLDACIKGVKLGAYHACIDIPFNLDPEEEFAENYVHIHVDLSQVNLAYSLLNEISNAVSVETTRLSVLFTKNLIDELLKSENTVSNSLDLMSGASEGLQVVSDNLDEAKGSLGDINLEVGDGFEDLNSLPSTADSIDSKISDLQLLSESLSEDYDDLLDEIDDLQRDYNRQCANSTDDEDCEDLSTEIDFLLDKQLLYEGYLEYTGNSSDELSDLIDDIRTVAYRASGNYNSLITDLAQAEAYKDSTITLIDDSTYSLEMIGLDISDVDSKLSNLLSGYAEIKLKDSDKIVNPLNISIKTVAEEGTYLDYSFPLLIILVISFLGILLSSNIVMIEKKSSAFFRNYITPAHDFMFLVSVYFVMLLIMIVDVVIVMFVASIFFNFTTSIYSLPSLLPAILLISTVFILIGMSIGFIFKDEEGATITSIFLSTILFLFSPIVIPLENMSLLLSKIASFSPLVLGMDILKKIIIFDVSITESGWSVLFLCVYIILLLFAIFSTHEFHKKRI